MSEKGLQIRIYFEGDPRLREGFSRFFSALRETAKRHGGGVQLIAAAGQPIQMFRKALRSNSAAYNLLLIDSEGPLSSTRAVQLCIDGGLETERANDIFFMVEMMESWFLTDRNALERFYGSDFQGSALAARFEVEKIAKVDIQDQLHRATRSTAKGSYFDHKANRGAALLSLIVPERVCAAAPNCKRLFDVVKGRLE